MKLKLSDPRTLRLLALGAAGVAVLVFFRRGGGGGTVEQGSLSPVAPDAAAGDAVPSSSVDLSGLADELSAIRNTLDLVAATPPPPTFTAEDIAGAVWAGIDAAGIPATVDGAAGQQPAAVPGNTKATASGFWWGRKWITKPGELVAFERAHGNKNFDINLWAARHRAAARAIGLNPPPPPPQPHTNSPAAPKPAHVPLRGQTASNAEVVTPPLHKLVRKPGRKKPIDKLHPPIHAALPGASGHLRQRESDGLPGIRRKRRRRVGGPQ